MSNYWFGQNIEEEKPWEEDSSWKELNHKRTRFARVALQDIIEILDSFSRQWTRGLAFYESVLPAIVAETGLAVNEVEKTLSLLPGLLSRSSLERRLAAEFQPVEMLDRFAKPPGFTGKVRAMPLGVLLHVTAGNVFLSSIDSLIMGFLTKNLSILKVSGQNKFFPLFFARKLAEFDSDGILSDKFAVLHWQGGDRSIEDLLKRKVNGIIAWGGEEMIASYHQNLPLHVKFLDFGPKISIQVVSREGLIGKSLQKVAEKIVADVIPWDQGACASPQVLYLQEGVDEKSFTSALNAAFEKAPPGGIIAPDEAVEILKEHQRALYSELMEGGVAIRGKSHLIHMEKSKILRPSPLNRSLILKRFKNSDELLELLSPFSFYMQSCACLISEKEKDEYYENLALAGIKRLAPLGTITWGMEGAPHDGRNVLRELTTLVGDEDRIVDFGEEDGQLSSSQELKAFFEKASHPPGYIISSGGTTGEPKFVHFSNEEMDLITDLLVENYKCQGLKAGMTVANLFVAGNLWSSFIGSDHTLKKLEVIQLPIGGLCPVENVIFYLHKFRPDAVIGIPSLLVTYAEKAEAMGVRLSIPKVFYAGEALSETRRAYLQKNWNTQYFGSAGYASVDAGIIGYQCTHCGPGEHHLFSELVEMKIVEGEAVISSLYRNTIPIKNYRTGDKVEWISDCDCGRADPRFRLLGRVDNIINIWSCRLRLEDIELSLREFVPSIRTFQLILEEELRGDGVRERMRLLIEGEEQEFAGLAERIYVNSRDLRDTISLAQFQSSFHVEAVERIERNARTGKITLVVDRRR